MSAAERVLVGLAVVVVVWLALETHDERLRLRRQEQTAHADPSTAAQEHDELAERRARRERRSA